MNSFKKSLRNDQIFKLVFASLLATMIIIMTFVDPLGYIPIGGVAITLIHIPVIVGGIVLGRKYGLVLGLVFGLGSMFRSLLQYTLHAPFVNPLLSVLPRMLFGFLVIDIYHFFNKYVKKEKLSLIIATGASSLFHSLIVLPLLYLFWVTNFYPFVSEYNFAKGTELANQYLSTNIFYFIYGIFVSNAIFEFLLAILIATPIIIALKALMKAKQYD